MSLEPVGPCPANTGWQHEVVKHVQEIVGVDKPSDIIPGAFAADLLVHA